MIKEIPSTYIELIKNISKANTLDINEDHSTLMIYYFRCDNQEMLNSLNNFINKISEHEVGECILYDDIAGVIDLSMSYLNNLKDKILNLRVNKSSINGLYYFFCIEGLAKAFENKEFTSNAKIVWISEEFVPFSSITTRFCQWGEEHETESGTEWNGLNDPRKILRELTVDSKFRVPDDIRQFLLKPNQDIKDSIVLKEWKIFAAKNLSFCLPSEVNFSQACNHITFKGEKLRDVQIDDELNQENHLDLFEILHECAHWIFINLQDSETKHTLFNYYLALEWREEKWPNKTYIERAFVSAREAFKLHLQRDSKDLLKVLAEIKKSLYDEVNKMSDNTRNIITNFWRDFAIAAIVLILKFVTGNQNISQNGIKILYSATSGFLLTSLIITIFINSRFNKIMKDNRDKWYDKLYSFLDKENLNDLVKNPISKSLNTYRWVISITFFIYIVMASFLLNIAFSFIKIF